MNPPIIFESGSVKSSGHLNGRYQVYRKYAENYHERFRAAIDYQFAEEPRQIIGLGILILGCVLFGLFWDSFHDPIEENYGTPLRSATASVLFTTLVYCFLQTRDGLLVRPHPGFWRIFHAIGLVHLLFFSVLAALPVEIGRHFVRLLLLPGVKEPSDTSMFEGTVDLQCELSLRTLKIQMSKMWFTSHIVGWFAKMCIFRDWHFCLFLSLAFESLELSFQWLIPELKECWWDSIILDVLLSNMIGMLIGVAVLRCCNSFGYDWMDLKGELPDDRTNDQGTLSNNNNNNYGIRDKTCNALMKFTPFTWSAYHWSFFRTTERLMQAIILLFLALMTELNVFFVVYALDIPAFHHYHKIRVAYLCFLALSGVAESYHYVNQGTSPHLRRRIGHNAWLCVAILSVEAVVIVRYGKTRFHKVIPDIGILIPWCITTILLSIWSFCHFFVIGPERLDIPRHIWQQLLQVTQKLQEVDPENDAKMKLEKLKEESQTSMTKAPIDDASFTTPVLRNPTTNKKNESQNHKAIDSSQEISDNIPAKKDSTHKGSIRSLAELMSPFTRVEATTSLQKELTTEDLQRTMALLQRMRLKWGDFIFNFGAFVVSYPPLLCFLPLLALIRYYDFD